MALLTDPFFLCIVLILVLAVLGLPIGLSMIGGSILYLFMQGLDMGIVAEQFLNRMYSNYIILAVFNIVLQGFELDFEVFFPLDYSGKHTSGNFLALRLQGIEVSLYAV